MLLENKTALVTGASRGIGAAIAELFVQHGASLVISGRSDTLHEVADRLTRDGGNVTAVQGDITDTAHVKQLVNTCRKTFGTLDILVNNAGVMLPGVVGMIAADDVRQMFEVNVLAAINLTQYAVRLMLKSSAPSIINMASIAGTEGLEGFAAYSASKAALIGFTQAAAKELAGRGIRVNALAPGYVDTDLTRTLPEQQQISVERIRLGRSGTPGDVAHAALFLASELSSYITGEVTGVDGGLTT